MSITDRFYHTLLRERDELTYQIGLYSGWIAQKKRRIERIDEQLTESERKGSGSNVNTGEEITVDYEALSEVRAKPKSADTVLKGVYYAADGSVVVTDRHRLLRIADAHNFAEPFVADAKTGVTIDGNFPDTSRIIPNEDGSTQIIVKGSQIKPLAARIKLAVDAVKLAGESTKIVTLKVSDECFELLAQYREIGVDLRLLNEGQTFGESLLVSCNVEYLLDAVNVFVDAGSPELAVNFYGKTRPIVLKDGANGIEAVVLPYRTAEPSE